ncbi:terpene synthase family protein [Kitasatospora sp. LaBMicrA B282]|uniref:terpene synthase family protein n=1 Tax=Kitasatospora sp. LaBMicrA B282 TaxID=3420949 RepID=UPI003D0B8688
MSPPRPGEPDPTDPGHLAALFRRAGRVPAPATRTRDTRRDQPLEAPHQHVRDSAPRTPAAPGGGDPGYRIRTGPSGPGTGFTRPHHGHSGMVGEQPVHPIPGLYWHPVKEPDPALVAELDRRIGHWAVHEVDLYPPEWEEQFVAFDFGRYVALTSPHAAGLDHLEAAARLLVAENAVDDCYCEDHGGSAHGLGARLLMAHSALEHPYSVEPYESEWLRHLDSEAPCRAYRSAMDFFDGLAPDQIRDREIHDLARLHLGYLAEAAWETEQRVPTVGEYLMVRQYNSFRPCLTIVDVIDGFALPADLHDHPAVQQVLALGSLATTLANDLYSYTKELRAKRPHVNLPTVLQRHEGLEPREAFRKAIGIHNTAQHRFEAAAAAAKTRLPDPTTAAYLDSVADWIDGNHWWHATNTRRYTLPDFGDPS